MGAAESTLTSDEPANTALASQKTHIFKLYSKQFEQPEEESESQNLYLDDYGEEELPTEETEPIPVETPSTSTTPEDEDYPIDTLNANLGQVEPEESQRAITPTPVEDTDTVPKGIRETFESSRTSTQSDLDGKYPALSVGVSPCESERSDLMQCYKENDEILNCREFVTKYSQCAKSSTSHIVNGRN